MEVTSTLQHKTTPESLEHVFGECAHYEYIKEIKSGQILFILGIWGIFWPVKSNLIGFFGSEILGQILFALIAMKLHDRRASLTLSSIAHIHTYTVFFCHSNDTFFLN